MSLLITKLDFHVKQLLKKDTDVEKARQQVTKDVENLIHQKQQFELKVNEMSDLYSTLQTERRKLRDFRQKLYKDLPQTQQAFQRLKADFLSLLKTPGQSSRSGSSGVSPKHDSMPCQITPSLAKKQTELYQQETYLIQKKLQLERTLDEYEVKLHSMSRQK